MINQALGCDTHVGNIVSQVSKKLHTLARTSLFMSIQKVKTRRCK